MLGKLLRIDVNGSANGLPYAIPLSNPFFGSIAGRDEIFAYGLRNPWRFAFDRITGAMWLADVGQGLREEVNTPMINGGNYGWRVYEGFNCTNNDRLLCDPAGFTFPLFDYNHAGGRCSITGGYVYRGTAGSLPLGTYVYGDYCSGEILAWDGSAQRVLINTGRNISSFAEDDTGEIYVVTLSGDVSRLVSTDSGGRPCAFDVAADPVIVNRAGTSVTIAISSESLCEWTATTTAEWITFPSGASGTGGGTLTMQIATHTGFPMPRFAVVTVAGRKILIIQG